jgi:hypothetical protein
VVAFDELHCPSSRSLGTITDIPPAFSHTLGSNAHTLSIVSHCPPCNPQIIFSDNGGMTKLARKINAKIVITIKITLKLLSGTAVSTKFMPNYSLFTLEVNGDMTPDPTLQSFAKEYRDDIHR